MKCKGVLGFVCVWFLVFLFLQMLFLLFFKKIIFNFVLLKDFFRNYNVVEWGNAYGSRLET